MSMYRFVWGAALLLAACVPPGCERRGGAPISRAVRPEDDRYNDDYIAALAAANEFCRAWRHGDAAAGTALLSRRVKVTYKDWRIRQAIVGLDNPHHMAFEIFDGAPDEAGGIVFPVKLFYKYLGQAQDRVEAPVERIVLVRDGSGRWLVDEFPLLNEPAGAEP